VWSCVKKLVMESKRNTSRLDGGAEVLNFNDWRDPCLDAQRNSSALQPANGRPSFRCWASPFAMWPSRLSEFSRSRGAHCGSAWPVLPACRLREPCVGGRRRGLLLPMDRSTGCGLAGGIAPGPPYILSSFSGISCEVFCILHVLIMEPTQAQRRSTRGSLYSHAPRTARFLRFHTYCRGRER